MQLAVLGAGAIALASAALAAARGHAVRVRSPSRRGTAGVRAPGGLCPGPGVDRPTPPRGPGAGVSTHAA
jgi:opine dehydrogenase